MGWYYPFGLLHKGYNNVVSSNGNHVAQKYKTYQGQEFHDELGLNVHEFKYRFYDATYARFWSIDPIAEDYAYNSTYAFSENKLGLGIELEGKELQLFTEIATSAAITFSQGVQKTTEKFNGGVRKVQQAHNESLMQKMSTPDPSFDSESARQQMVTQITSGLSQMAEATGDLGHVVADATGTIDPTGIIDLAHAGVYAAEGDYLNAGLTAFGIFA